MINNKINKIMEQYNEQTLNSYFQNNDLYGAADYLSKFKAKDARSQLELNSRIRQLRKDAEIQKAYVSKLDQEGKDAFYFTNGLKNGNIPHTRYDDNGKMINNTANSYGDKYIDIINNLKIDDDFEDSDFAGQPVDKIILNWNDEEAYNSFLNNLGIKDIKNNDLGIKGGTYNGKTRTYIDKTNPNLVKILKAAKSTDDFWSTLEAGVAAGAGVGSSIGAAIGSPVFGVGAVPSGAIGAGIGSIVGAGTAIAGFYDEPFFIEGQATSKKKSTAGMQTNSINADSLDDLIDLVDEAEEIDKENEEKIQTVETTEEITISQFLGAGHAQAFQAYSSGAITLDQYNKIVEERTKTYDRLLGHVDLTQYKVYKAEQSDEGNFVMRQMDDNKERANLMKILSVALHDKRVSYAAAMKGGEVGTYITIAAGKNDKGDLSDGDTEQFTRIFVPGLFKSSCDEIINSDTKTMAARDNADMKRFQYGKRLHDGKYVGYNDAEGHYSITTDEDGNEIRQSISEAEMLQNLNRDHIIDMSVDQIIFQLDNTDNEINIEDLCKLAANAGTNDLYPEGAYTRKERIYQQQLLYNDIYELIMSLYGNNNNKKEEE